MASETWWNCIFVRPDGRFRYGAITQEYGLRLAEFILEEQQRLRQHKKRVPITICNTGTDEEFQIVDVLYVEFERELA